MRLFLRGYLDEPLTNIPLATVANDSYLPHTCELYPERVTEYPDVMDLGDSHPDIMEEIDSSDELNELAEAQDQDIIEDVATLYQYWLSVASGIKVAGYPNWSQFPEVPECTCGRPMDYLLTITGDEFDGGTRQRWAAKEDKAILESEDFAARAAIREPTGLLLGRGYTFNFFVCRHCEGWPVEATF